MAGQDTNDGIQGQGSIGKAMKRRGILAAAGAAVAGIVAKQTAQTVGALDGPLTLATRNNVASAVTVLFANASFNDDVLMEFNATTITSSTSSYTHAISADGAGAGGYGVQASGAGAFGNGVNAVGGNSTTSDIAGWGVHGVGGGNSTTGRAGHGIMGRGGNATSGQGGYGVFGWSGDGAQPTTGVLGFTDSVTAGGMGVRGTVAASTGATGTYAVYGENLSTGAGGIGIYGIIPGGSAPGTIAISGSNNATAANSHGIVGVATVGHGLVGTTNYTPPAGGGPPYYAGLVGNATHGAYAGLFFGNVSITGALNGHTSIVQHANLAVAHPDGTHRLAQPVVSPEGWLEDFGDGTLTNGHAEVKIDPAFAALADMGKYHVFLTEHGDYHLHVAERKADGFVVRVSSGASAGQPTGGGPVGVSQVAKAGSGTGTFSWRMAAKRKDGQAERLATYTFPNVTPPHIPEPPKAAAIQTKP